MNRSITVLRRVFLNPKINHTPFAIFTFTVFDLCICNDGNSQVYRHIFVHWWGFLPPQIQPYFAVHLYPTFWRCELQIEQSFSYSFSSFIRTFLRSHRFCQLILRPPPFYLGKTSFIHLQSKNSFPHNTDPGVNVRYALCCKLFCSIKQKPQKPQNYKQKGGSERTRLSKLGKFYWFILRSTYRWNMKCKIVRYKNRTEKPNQYISRCCWVDVCFLPR